MSNNLSFKDVFIKGAVIYNPVLVQLVGLCPVVAASTSLGSAVMLSAALCLELIITCVIASALLKKIPRWIRVSLYLIIGIAVVCPILWYVETMSLVSLSLGMKIYVPLIAVNSMTAVHCEQFSVKNSVKHSFFDAAAAGIGASIIFILVGALRELFGVGTIGGMEVNMPVTFKGMALPFGCFVILGFMAAGLKAFVAKFYSAYSDDEESNAEPVQDFSDEVTEVELFEEFWAEPAETVREEIPVEESAPEEVSLDIPEEITAEEPARESGHSFNSAAELDDFLRSLGIDIDGKGDKQ